MYNTSQLYLLGREYLDFKPGFKTHTQGYTPVVLLRL
jgi:hypothetical protein